jgi:class 3 adenylate cyclase
MTSLIQQHNGKVLDSPGDNLLAEFVSVVDAVQCAVAVQKEFQVAGIEISGRFENSSPVCLWSEFLKVGINRITRIDPVIIGAWR